MNARVVIPNEDVISADLEDGEGVIVDLRSKRYYLLNETAMLVWLCLEIQKPVDEIVEELTSVYDVSRDRAAESVGRFLSELDSYELIYDLT